ncbi:3-hydroxybutyryl-CoA dehydrogenase [Actinokineospora spheciospongiae]|uniref:3-hydroxybutyryl-CoA dehydrogenase n=1 Tax=Actinokineospora spheciospongiae TaxID=909613 RepID=W7ITV8_9PSEU|nr:3-hydroxyacyl-CoA dehydrogenase family protein [Actinokineospora spheciospongiae]EWC59826.1 3-hydroxybutyryl-CoA dehydrogenase [Actinokineospora spheciospongiae]PWW63142.1 methoxymalonate biosynthesis protein [Actinokineospora spheciospongiae]
MGDSAFGRVAIIGAGVMGTGIATLAVGSGLPVVLVDLDRERLERARAGITAQTRLGRLMGSFDRGIADGELETTTDPGRVAGAAALIESVTEKVEAKARALTASTAALAPGTVVVSNTSAIPIDELAGYTARPEDVVGIHFMNPPYLIRTVELIRGPRSGDAAIASAERLLAALGQTPVHVGDGPGFVVNRVLQRSINEAARIVQDGVATPEAVDAAFTGCLGHRTGPLATADLIGLDNVVDSLHVLLERTGDEGYRPCDLLVGKVAAGHFGRKTGRGFFEYRTTS